MDFKKALWILFKLSRNQQRTKTLKEKKFSEERGIEKDLKLLYMLHSAEGEFIGSVKETFLEHDQNLDPLY